MATTTIQLNIDNSLIADAIAALNKRSGYQVTLDDGSANPVTPAQNAKQEVLKFIKNAVIEYRNQQVLAAVQTPSDTLLS